MKVEINEKINNLEKLIKEGKNGSEIAKLMNISKGWAYQIIEKYELKDLYKKIQIEKQLKKKADEEKERHEEKEENGTRRDILKLFSQRALHLAEKESWGARKAIEYLLCTKGEITYYPPEKEYKTHHSFFELKTIFDRYHEAEQKGIKLSLEEIAEKLDIYASSCGLILKKSGLEPMYGTRKRSSPISEEKIEAIKRAYATGLTFVDIGYFLNLPHYTCQQRTKKSREQKKLIKIWSKRIEECAPHTEASLSYRLASQIYESIDLGFNQEQTSFLLDAKDFVVEYALEHRTEIEPKLIDQLKILYNNPNHNKPYKQGI